MGVGFAKCRGSAVSAPLTPLLISADKERFAIPSM